MALPSQYDVRLIPGEPEALVVSAHHLAGDGWVVKISVRRQFELWGESASSTYEHLTTEELVDLVETALAVELLS